MRSNYTIQILRREAELEALQPEWSDLYEASADRNPFLSYEWTAGCWQHLCSGASPFVVAARREGRLVGVAPLRLRRQLGFRVLRFIGDPRSDYLGFLA